MISFYLLLIGFFLLSLFTAYIINNFLIPKFIKLVKNRGFVGRDMNKPKKPIVAELGGIPNYLSFSLSFFSVLIFYYIFFNSLNVINFTSIFLIYSMILIIFFMGFIDDILGWKKGINHLQHLLYPILFSVPMIIYSMINNITHVFIPLIGDIHVGILYSFILVPLAITATTNSFNLLAGFNGLEVGLSIIIFFTISIFSIFKGNFSFLIILGAYLGSLIAFYKYNKFPSKIFGGDMLTLTNGVLAGISAIVLNLEFLIFFLIILYIIEFIIKAKHKFKTECFGVLDKKGYLLPRKEGGSLTHVVLGLKKFREKNFVHTFFFIQIIISLISLLLFFVFYL